MSFPTGTHRVKPVDAVLGMTGTGKEQIGVLFEHIETGERITWYGYFTDGTFERTIESLRHIGWTGNDLTEFMAGLPDGVGNEVDVVVEDEQDQRDGTMRRKVRWVNSGSGVAVKERLSGDQLKSFAARMQKRIAASHAVAGAKAPATKPDAPKATRAKRATAVAARGPERTIDPGVDDADIPF